MSFYFFSLLSRPYLELRVLKQSFVIAIDAIDWPQLHMSIGHNYSLRRPASRGGQMLYIRCRARSERVAGSSEAARLGVSLRVQRRSVRCRAAPRSRSVAAPEVA